MNLKAMVVEDDPSIRDMLELSLVLEGCSVTTAPSGSSALEILMFDRPDVILVDLMMPDMNGYEVIEQLRQDDLHASTPVIVLTAKASDEDVWEGWRRGADSYLTKPVDIGVLVDEITRLTSGRCVA